MENIYFVTFFVYYGLIFRYLKHSLMRKKTLPGREINLISKIISCIHSFMIIISASLYLTNYASVHTWTNMINITKAYSLFDIFLVFLHRNSFKNDWKETIVHHFILFVGTFYIHEYPDETARIILAEISNFPLHYCWYLINVGKQKNIKFMISALLTLLAFTIFRVINLTHMLYCNIHNMDNMSVTCLSLLTLMNYRWYYILVKKAYKMVNGIQ